MISEAVEQYIASHWQGGLIGIDDLANYCGVSKWDVYSALVQLERDGKLTIVNRYLCPDGHSVPEFERPFCPSCEFTYSNSEILVTVYIQPTTQNPASFNK